jgi:hypothetical protein
MDPTILGHFLNFVGYFSFVIILYQVVLLIMTIRWLNSPDANVMKVLLISFCLATAVPLVFGTVGGYLLWRMGYFGDYGLVEEEAPLE